MTHGIQFGCGEFVPGGTPITVPDLPVTPAAILIPGGGGGFVINSLGGAGGGTTGGGGGGRPPIPSDRRSGPPKWKCVTLAQTPQTAAPLGQEYVNPNQSKVCFPCDGDANTNLPGGFNPSPNDLACVYATKPDCIAGPCVDETRNIGSGGLGGTTGGKNCKCVYSSQGEDVFVSQDPQGCITRKRKFNYTCQDVIGAAPIDPIVAFAAARRSPLSKNVRVTGFGSVTNPCSRNNCGGNCGSRWVFWTYCPQGPMVFQEFGALGGSPRIQAAPGGGEPPATGESNLPGSMPGVQIINIQDEMLKQYPPNPNIEFQGSKLFNPRLNFFDTAPKYKTKGNASIVNYQNIFKNRVPISVANFINNEGSNAVWNESFFTLNLEDIRVSINSVLLSAFKTIHYPGGQLVGERPFLEMVKKHILTGTLSEFDPSFYMNLARTQLGDRKIIYTGTSNKEVSERGGLGVISSESVLADSEGQVNIRKRQMRRQRRLNTDIKAKCIICRSGYGTEAEQDLYLNDSGICVVTSGTQDNISVPTGNGDGYYMYINQVDLNCTPLVTTNDSSKTYYVPEKARFNALTLFNQSKNVTLTASSLEGHNELTAGDTGVSALRPLYMALDLDSIKLITNKNPLVSTYTVSYTVLEDQTLIDEHTKNNGMAISRVNIDYRDPLYRYILDTSSVDLQQHDINFKAVKTGRDYPGGILIAKNVPFGLIVTPVVGSKFNPFNGFSKITYFEDKIVRSLQLSPDIQGSDISPNKPQLKELNLYNNAGGELKVGLVEPDDTQNVFHKYEASSSLYTETFYRDGLYQASTSPVSSNGISYLIKDVLDYLYTTYSPDEILWFDVFRRMPLNKVGELFYDTNRELMSRLEIGFRNNIKINYLLYSGDGNDLSDQVLTDDDKVIIKVGDRY